jgi:hypothetical protein
VNYSVPASLCFYRVMYCLANVRYWPISAEPGRPRQDISLLPRKGQERSRPAGTDPKRTVSTDVKAHLRNSSVNANIEPVCGISARGTDNDQILSSPRQFTLPCSCVVCLSCTF